MSTMGKGSDVIANLSKIAKDKRKALLESNSALDDLFKAIELDKKLEDKSKNR